MRDKKKTLDKKIDNVKLKEIAKKQKLKEHGITLIALVVTIIILLILAGVTLNITLSDNGLFSKARKATEDYKEAQNEEEYSLLEYEYEMAKLQGEISETETVGEYSMEKEIKEIYGKEIKIGDTVNYDPKIEGNTYEGTWKVLGIEDGKILLLSSERVDILELNGVEGYKTAIESLDNICEKYGNSTVAEEARSLRVEDINRITGYNPKKQMDGKICNEGTLSEYGITVNCEIKENKIIYSSNELKEEREGKDFVKEDGTMIGENQNTSFKNNFYSYMVAYGYLDENKLETRDFEVKDSRWLRLFEGFRTSDTWLANRTIFYQKGVTYYHIRSLQCGMNGHILGYPCIVAGFTVFRGDGTANKQIKAVHAVVRLSENIKFIYDEEKQSWAINE